MVLVVLLFPALALGGEVKLEDLVKTDGYFKKESSGTGRKTVLGSNTTTTESYGPKEPGRTGKWMVLGSVITITDS